ncbi:hypothetical protein V9T40_007201 [Parthenolecanium corni]|uniref:LRRCT domain-containing protein n=1 Tax=Parthenolecanium corni TaxID=536013 RepID=A0AAN9Y9L2_9HEMI
MALLNQKNKLLATLITITIIAVVASSQDEKSQPCPDACSCPNIPPALGLVCNGQNLTSIPAVNISAHFVDFSGNPLGELTNQTLAPIRNAHNLEILVLKACAIYSIENDAFDKLENLRFVDLSSNGIATLAPGVFTKLLHLSEINLSENNITNVSTHWFAESAPIRVLNLTANPIKHLEANVFDRLNSLEELRLDQCELHLIDSHAFDGLFKLHTLNLSHNQLTTITADSITWLRELHTLELNANPWQCDCNLQAVTVILLMRGFQTLAANLTCSISNNELSNWIDVNTTHPDCDSQIKMHARRTSLIGNSEKHRIKAAKLLSTNASRLSAASALFFSQKPADTYSPAVIISLWCAVIILLAIASYTAIYVTSKMCVYATTKAASAAKHAAHVNRKKSIVRRGNRECEQALVNDTSHARDNFYMVDEASSDVSIIAIDG